MYAFPMTCDTATKGWLVLESSVFCQSKKQKWICYNLCSLEIVSISWCLISNPITFVRPQSISHFPDEICKKRRCKKDWYDDIIILTMLIK